MDNEKQQQSILGAKQINYAFLLLVRDQKYPQALKLGKKILKEKGDNISVRKFCTFIESNFPECTNNFNIVIKMVEQQKQEQQYQSLDEDQQQQQQQSQQKESSSQKQNQSQQQEQQQHQQIKIQKPRIQLTTCTLNQIPHICPRNHKQQIQKQ